MQRRDFIKVLGAVGVSCLNNKHTILGIHHA